MPDTRSYPPPYPDRTVWTVADLEALPDDGNRYEILYGELLAGVGVSGNASRRDCVDA